MKCEIQFSGKNKKLINLSFAEFAQRVVKVKMCPLIFNNLQLLCRFLMLPGT